MSKKSSEFSEFTIHVVLATIPQQQEREFHECVKADFYENYRTESDNYTSKKDKDYWYYKDKKTVDRNTPVLYNPLHYYILGNYDVAYISLIDNFKFAQRLFEPQSMRKGTPELFMPHTFQSFTGITTHPGDELKFFFYKHLRNNNPVRKYFIGICNLKLNNGFLIGNGTHYVHAVQAAIRKTVSEKKDVEFLLLQSFSWFELSLMLFTDDPEAIKDIIITLRADALK